MKLRCTKDYIRIRVRKSDLETLEIKGIVSESISFSKGVELHFSIKNSDVSELQASFSDNTITIFLPQHTCIKWIHSDQVGLDNVITVGKDKFLTLLVEKDFPCKDREDEDKTDTFWELTDPDNVC